MSLLLASCGGCGDDPDVWRLDVFPDASAADGLYIGEYDSLEACRATGRTLMDLRYRGAEDFECSLNCYLDRGGLTVCEKIIDSDGDVR